MNETIVRVVEIIFGGFWSGFIGLFMFAVTLNFFMNIWNRTLRHWNIRKHGYPPAHCDADGDFKKESKKKNT